MEMCNGANCRISRLANTVESGGELALQRKTVESTISYYANRDVDVCCEADFNSPKEREKKTSICKPAKHRNIR